MQMQTLYTTLAEEFGTWAYTWPFGLTAYDVTVTRADDTYGQSVAEQCGISTFSAFVEAIS